MNWKFLSIGLLLTCSTINLIAQETYILNREAPVQISGTFNISGRGAARKFVALSDRSDNTNGHHLFGLHKINPDWAGVRWGIGLIGNETGTNAQGSNFAIWSYNDNASYKSTAFYIDRPTAAIGIGSTSPADRLHVSGGNIRISPPPTQNGGLNIGNSNNNRWAWVRLTNTDPNAPDGFSLYEDNTGVGGGLGTRLWITKGGHFGIGDQPPTAPFQIKSGGQVFKFIAGPNTSGYAITQSVNDDGMNFSLNTNVRGFNFVTTRGRLFTIDSVGNVRIGDHAPNGYKLSVNGSAIFTKAVVKAYANWPDFVFEEDFKLQPIEEVMAYVKENKHLPGIPSAKEVAEKGQDLGEMNAKLLQKIEELTLYIAEMKKEIDALKAERK
ncbi:hypothetical protein [Chitinophaga rhizosphaerae]|uniref:hypothetical protein n=1 Tax=Chitinophaga rhizosphaerae TaxID=1864947 RepID=UPI000F814084|nr:hypothetical protein [Chitinophaga rhizosphaerae]